MVLVNHCKIIWYCYRSNYYHVLTFYPILYFSYNKSTSLTMEGQKPIRPFPWLVCFYVNKWETILKTDLITFHHNRYTHQRRWKNNLESFSKQNNYEKQSLSLSTGLKINVMLAERVILWWAKRSRLQARSFEHERQKSC